MTLDTDTNAKKLIVFFFVLQPFFYECLSTS